MRMTPPPHPRAVRGVRFAPGSPGRCQDCPRLGRTGLELSSLPSTPRASAPRLKSVGGYCSASRRKVQPLDRSALAAGFWRKVGEAWRREGEGAGRREEGAAAAPANRVPPPAPSLGRSSRQRGGGGASATKVPGLGAAGTPPSQPEEPAAEGLHLDSPLLFFFPPSPPIPPAFLKPHFLGLGPQTAAARAFLSSWVCPSFRRPERTCALRWAKKRIKTCLEGLRQPDSSASQPAWVFRRGLPSTGESSSEPAAARAVESSPFGTAERIAGARKPPSAGSGVALPARS